MLALVFSALQISAQSVYYQGSRIGEIETDGEHRIPTGPVLHNGGSGNGVLNFGEVLAGLRPIGYLRGDVFLEVPKSAG